MGWLRRETGAGASLQLPDRLGGAKPRMYGLVPLNLKSQRGAVYAALTELDIHHELRRKINTDDYQRTRAALLTPCLAEEHVRQWH